MEKSVETTPKSSYSSEVLPSSRATRSLGELASWKSTELEAVSPFRDNLLSEPSPKHPGQNQDRAFVVESSPLLLMGVADGVGSQPASERAAATVEAVAARLAQELSPSLSPTELETHLANTIRQAHEKIVADNNETHTQGAATATLFTLNHYKNEHYASWATVGDSRLMVFHPDNSTLRSLTLDESGLSIHKPSNKRREEQQQLDSVRTIEDYDNLPPYRQVSYDKRYLIAHAAGSTLSDNIQTGSRLVESGDIVFATTDGYTDNFTEEELAQLLSEAIAQNDNRVEVKQIIEHMNEQLQWFMRNYRHKTDSIRGKQDDASIVMMEVLA